MHLNSPTIAGYDDGLADVFDELLKYSYEDSPHFFISYSDPDTFDVRSRSAVKQSHGGILNSATIRMVRWHHLL
jgi:hypothetical protein